MAPWRGHWGEQTLSSQAAPPSSAQSHQPARPHEGLHPGGRQPRPSPGSELLIKPLRLTSPGQACGRGSPLLLCLHVSVQTCGEGPLRSGFLRNWMVTVNYQHQTNYGLKLPGFWRVLTVCFAASGWADDKADTWATLASLPEPELRQAGSGYWGSWRGECLNERTALLPGPLLPHPLGAEPTAGQGRAARRAPPRPISVLRSRAPEGIGTHTRKGEAEAGYTQGSRCFMGMVSPEVRCSWTFTSTSAFTIGLAWKVARKLRSHPLSHRTGWKIRGWKGRETRGKKPGVGEDGGEQKNQEDGWAVGGE